jgi:hypothetical protein
MQDGVGGEHLTKMQDREANGKTHKGLVLFATKPPIHLVLETQQEL